MLADNDSNGSTRTKKGVAIAATMALAISITVTPASAQAANENIANERIETEIRNFLLSFRTVGSRIIFTFVPANGPLSGRFAITSQENEANLYPGNRCSHGQAGSAESCDNNGSDADPSPSPSGPPGGGNPNGGEE